MDKELIKLLAEFFLEEFANDASGVGEWVEAGGQDPEEIIPAVQELKRTLDAE